MNARHQANIAIEINAKSFNLLSSSEFEIDGRKQTRYSVTTPKGKKVYHLMGYENGAVVLLASLPLRMQG